MAGAWLQPAAVAFALAAAAVYLARRAWGRIARARRPRAGPCGPDCGCGDATDH